MIDSASDMAGFSLGEAAHYLGLSERTVRRLVTRGLLTPARFGRRVVFPRPELDRCLQASMAKAA